MIIRTVLFAVLTVSAFCLLIYNLRGIFSYLKIAQSENRRDKPLKRFTRMLTIALGQTKILREKSAGFIHVAIFWGFLIFLLSASEAVIQGFFIEFSWNFLGPVYTIITFFSDIFAVLILLAVLWALIRRFVFRVDRLKGDVDEKIDALIVLFSIFIITTSVIFQNAALAHIEVTNTIIQWITNQVPTAIIQGNLAAENSTNWAFRPLSLLLFNIYPNYEVAVIFYGIFWWVHILFIFGFMNYLPFSKHFHVYTSIPNVYFSTIGPVNKLDRIDFEKEGIEKFGVVDVEDFSWKTLLDGYSCTHCGRCDSVCPANTTGKILSPRNVIVNIRNRTFDKAPILLKPKKVDEEFSPVESVILDKKFIGEYENIEALWQCTTCAACMQECPVTIEHVPAIVNMRRSLVMMESNFPSLLQSAFNNLENNATPWAFSQMERADWATGTGVKTAAENPDFDVLFWVGCAGSYDDRAKQISVAFSKLLQQAGVNFSILGTEEMCNGDPARRAGHEYLADMLIKGNIETLNRYNVRKIVTFCPHCFNTFKNEYPDFSANFEVIHHSEFLLDLVKQGKLKLREKKSEIKITYHDSCYLGRYNNIISQPRSLLTSIPGLKITEAERSKDRGFCCGAGGAQMFMEETEGKRVNIERTEELLSTEANTISTNCPFCMTMITDGIKAKDKVEEVKVKDIAEILLENIV